MKKLTVNDLKTAVKDNNIVQWSPRECSICGCPVVYKFYDGGDTVVFDGSCDCVLQSSGERLSSYEQLVEIYNNADDEYRLKMLNDFSILNDDMVDIVEEKSSNADDVVEYLKKLQVKFTDEFFETASKNSYNEDREYPENFSNWYKHIIDFGEFKHADIISNQVFTWEDTNIICKDDSINKVDWISINNILKPTLDKMKPNKLYNIKNGAFSNKFDFDTCVTTKDELAEKFWKIEYQSALLDTGGYTELVVREYIPYDHSVTPTIYNGMPLREEIRVFYNMDTKCIEYMVDYWDYGYCYNKFSTVTDEIVFDYFHNKFGRRFTNHNSKLEEIKQQIQDSINTLKFDNCLSGVWSIDFMYVDDLDEYNGIWLIDMARAHRSAYWNPANCGKEELV